MGQLLGISEGQLWWESSVRETLARSYKDGMIMIMQAMWMI